MPQNGYVEGAEEIGTRLSRMVEPRGEKGSVEGEARICQRPGMGCPYTEGNFEPVF